jgi:hypothetical protein
MGAENLSFLERKKQGGIEEAVWRHSCRFGNIPLFESFFISEWEIGEF